MTILETTHSMLIDHVGKRAEVVRGGFFACGLLNDDGGGDYSVVLPSTAYGSAGVVFAAHNVANLELSKNAVLRIALR